MQTTFRFESFGLASARVLVFAAFVLTSCGTVLAEEATSAISIRLESAATVSSREIRLRDVASIRCRDANTKDMVGAIDLAQLKDNETSRVLSASFVRIRLLLAGWQADQLSVDGPDEIHVTYREPLPLTDADIELAALATMQTILNTEPDRLRVRLTAPFMQVLPANLQKESGLRAEVLPPIRTEPGPNTLTVRLWKGPLLVATRSARVDVLRRQRVAVARVSFRRDHVLTESDVQFESRFLAKLKDEPEEAQVIGRRPRRSVEPGEILSLRDLQDPLPQERPLVVKARDRVRVTAVSGVARVTLRTAEAMQPGRVGDVIQVKNLDSDRVISGKVTAAGQVEIQLR